MMDQAHKLLTTIPLSKTLEVNFTFFIVIKKNLISIFFKKNIFFLNPLPKTVIL